MLLACALALLAVTDPAQPGRVAIVPEAFAFEAALARELCPDAEARVVIRIGTAGVDPLAELGAAPAPVALDMQLARPGDDRVLAARVTSARCVQLEGGTWIDWWFALRPWGKQSQLGRALRTAHEGGTNVIGVGPAGAHLATLCVLARETLQRPSRDPHSTARDVVLGGLGLARGACIDFATDGRTDPERLLEAALDRRVELMVWLAGPCAWIEDPTRRTAIVAGPGAAFVFDARDARRSREVVAGVRLTRLTAGGTFDFLAPRALPPRHAREKRTVQNDAQPLLRDVFGAPSAGNAWNSSKEWTLAGEGRCLRITFETASDGARDTPAIPGRDEARLDWLPRRP